MKLTKRMEGRLAEIRRQMLANEERGDRLARSARESQDDGRYSFAARQFAQAAGSYHMACAYAIALQETYRGLAGEAAWPHLDDLANRQGRYARAAGDMEAGMDDPIRGLQTMHRGDE